jgi:hypothetical protein
MRERPVSVTIFGILNIGFALMGLAGLLMSESYESLPHVSSNPFLSSVIAFLDGMNKNPNYVLWRNITLPLESVASLILLASGIGLLLLKNWSRLASIGYAIYKIIFLVANLIVLPLVLGGLLQKLLQNIPSVLVFFLAGVTLGGLVLSLAYPVLLLFFLTRPKILPAFQPAPLPPGSPL